MNDYPRILIHHGKHGNRHIASLNKKEEDQSWVSMVLLLKREGYLIVNMNMYNW